MWSYLPNNDVSTCRHKESQGELEANGKILYIEKISSEGEQNSYKDNREQRAKSVWTFVNDQYATVMIKEKIQEKNRVKDE